MSASPRRLLALVAFASLLALAAGGCGRERERPSERPGPRVVCLTPSSTELVAAVGGVELIVGVDQYSTYPSAVRSLPKVGDFLAPNVEAILALTPDIAVLDAVQDRAAAVLKSAGITTVSLPLQTISDIRTAIGEIGRALGREEAAARRIASLDADLERIGRTASARIAAAGRRPRVLFVVDRQLGGLGSLVAAGPGTYLHELLERAGGENVLADSPVRYAQISIEEVLRRDPDVILDAVHTRDATRARADWGALGEARAVREGRVHVLADTLFVSPGPRLAEALDRLTTLVWAPPSP